MYSSSSGAVGKSVSIGFLCFGSLLEGKTGKTLIPYVFYCFVLKNTVMKSTSTVVVREGALLAGQFKPPENRQLISAFYWVSSSQVFLKDVAVNIQHCAEIENEEQCLDFRFIIARCSQKELPYRFKEFEGLFSPYTQYASIDNLNLESSIVLGISAPHHTKIRCVAFMYYKQQTDTPGNVEFHFVLVKELPSVIEVLNHMARLLANLF